jgi:hypothetical protein
MRLSQEKRERFLEVLGQTGNRRTAARAIGVEPRLMDQRREFDAAFDRQWRAAVEQADRRLAGATGPLDCIGGAEPMVIRRGQGGKLRIVAAGKRRWSAPVEERFLAALAATGNIAAAARAVGFSASCIAQRRRQWPDFARRMEEALDDAELEIEFRMAAHVRGVRDMGLDGGGASDAGGAGAAGAHVQIAEGPLDLDAAMRFLKWREEKRRGGGRRGRVPAPPGIEEVTDKIVRQVSAIKRHGEARRIEEGWTRTEEGHMIPPGWVREQPPE